VGPIDGPLVNLDFQADIGVAAAELWQYRREMVQTERGSTVESQLTARRKRCTGDLKLRLLDLVQDGPHSIEE
jgi:hypothetical protein